MNTLTRGQTHPIWNTQHKWGEWSQFSKPQNSGGTRIESTNPSIDLSQAKTCWKLRGYLENSDFIDFEPSVELSAWCGFP
jgi:hypothetical protein